MTILTLFLSSAKSLLTWEREGILSREILVYRELLRRGIFDTVQIFSYDAADQAFLTALRLRDAFYDRVLVLTPPEGRAGAGWAMRGVLHHRRAIARSTALKTNQGSGSWAALIASRLTGRPLVFRMGYILSRRFMLNGQNARARAAALVERLVADRARYIIVTSADAAAHFRARPAWAGKVRHLPTYVDTSVFSSKQHYDFDAPLIAVARMQPQKNLPALLAACAMAGRDLVLVGKGDQEAELRAMAADLPVSITFAGTLDNVEIALLMSQHSIFMLPSLHEGLPKVLIEAMASGLICIGSPISGTMDLITDGETGYLTDGFEPADIARAIDRARREKNSAIGARARARIEAIYGLEQYVDAESALYQALAD